MIIVNLERDIGCDVPITDTVLLAPDNMSQFDVNKISTNIGIKCLKDASTDNARILFKEYGFVEVSYINCCVGGDL